MNWEQKDYAVSLIQPSEIRDDVYEENLINKNNHSLLHQPDSSGQVMGYFSLLNKL